MNYLEEKLANIFNLSKYEARLYLALLNFSHASLSDLAKKAQIARTAAYPPLQSLIAKGLIAAIQIGKRKKYQALSPKMLPNILKRKSVDLEEAVSELSKKLDVPESNFCVQYFSGREGVKTASDIFLAETKSKRGKSFENIIDSIGTYGSRQTEAYIKDRSKKGIYGRMIASGNPENPALKKMTDNKKDYLLKSVIVSQATYPFIASIAVSDEMLLIYTSKDPLFAVLIKNKDIAKTMDSIHNIAWERYVSD